MVKNFIKNGLFYSVYYALPTQQRYLGYFGILFIYIIFLFHYIFNNKYIQFIYIIVHASARLQDCVPKFTPWSKVAFDLDHNQDEKNKKLLPVLTGQSQTLLSIPSKILKRKIQRSAIAFYNRFPCRILIVVLLDLFVAGLWDMKFPLFDIVRLFLLPSR